MSDKEDIRNINGTEMHLLKLLTSVKQDTDVLLGALEGLLLDTEHKGHQCKNSKCPVAYALKIAKQFGSTVV